MLIISYRDNTSKIVEMIKLFEREWENENWNQTVNEIMQKRNGIL